MVSANKIVILKQYEKDIGNVVQQCGLFIDVEHPFLCIYPVGLLKIKCLYSARNVSYFHEIWKNHNEE